MHSPGRLRLLRPLWLALWLGACGGPEPTPVDGAWLVDFGSTEGVLLFERGEIAAHCYANQPIGRYTLEDDRLEMTVTFEPGTPPVEFSGWVTQDDDGSFRMHFTRKPGGRGFDFTPYDGDCSEAYASGGDFGGGP